MKIDAPKAFMCGQATVSAEVADRFHEQDVRIVRESDWRKIMAVVKATAGWRDVSYGTTEDSDAQDKMIDSIDALREHLEKRK